MSKGKKSTGGEKWGTEDVLQAVVIADDFNERFLPMTLEKPSALLPLVNAPLIDYTFEFLARSGVRETFVVCRQTHADQMEAHVKKSKWTSKNSPMTIALHASSDEFASTGDALRAVDAKSLVRNDFVLVTGHLVANMNLDATVRAHRDRRRVERDSVMTMVFKTAAPGHRTRTRDDDCLVALAASTGRLLHLQRTGNRRRVAMPLAIFDDREAVSVRYDVLDCHVSVCSPQVLEIFTDNFDYQDRDDFVRGLLVSEEITGNQIHAYVIGDEYASPVSNLFAYDAISKDVMRRWTYPLVPDHHDANVAVSRRNIYVHSEVSLARDSSLEKDVVIGAGTTVGPATFISRSVLGNDCRIGSRVRLVDAYIWDGVVVGDDVVVETSILCSGARIEKGVKLRGGCIVSYGVSVGPDVEIPEGTYLTLHQSDSTTETDSTDLLGASGRGHVWTAEEDSDKEEGGRNVWGQILGYQSDSTDVESNASTSPRHTPVPFDVDEERIFHGEVLDSVRNGMIEKVPVENLILEVNSSKHAYNISISDVPNVVLKTVLAGPVRDDSSPAMQPRELLTHMNEAFAYLSPLFRNYVKTLDGQIQLIFTAEEQAATNSVLASLFSKLLQILYDKDVVEEEAIRKWFYGGSKIECHDKLKATAQKFVQWLEEASSESD